MITESTIYWITRLDVLIDFEIALAIGGTALGVFALVMMLFSITEEVEFSKKWLIIPTLMIFLGGLAGLGRVFTPTTKEMCAIKVVPMIVKDKQIQELPNKVVELANEWLDELKPNKIDGEKK